MILSFMPADIRSHQIGDIGIQKWAREIVVPTKRLDVKTQEMQTKYNRAQHLHLSVLDIRGRNNLVPSGTIFIY
jgi:hypothetical protein